MRYKIFSNCIIKLSKYFYLDFLTFSLFFVLVFVDNYFNFWFRFIYKYKSAIEIENYEFVKEIVKRDFNVYSGKFLEKYFIEKLKLINDYSNIGTYWEKANQNEIDIVAINDLDKKALIAEVKINPKKIDLEILKQKAKKLEKELNTYECEYLGFSLNDM